MPEIEPATTCTWGVARAIVQAKKYEDAIAGCIREWAIAHPDQLVALDRIIRYQRTENGYRRAWGGEAGKLESGARFAEVPRTLWTLMQRKIRRDFWDHQDLIDAFFRHFKVGMIRPNDRPKLGRHW